jgi:hypothetical protein
MTDNQAHHDEGYWGRSHSGHVVLDIGQNVGALILYTRQELCGREIEISRADRVSPRVHTAILERIVGSRTVYAGVYPELEAGDYRLWGDDPLQPVAVTIVAGSVAEVDWS